MPSLRVISDGLAAFSAFALLAILPVAMAIANRSSAAVLGVAASALLLAALIDGEPRARAVQLARALARGMTRPLTLAMLALIALALVSIPRTAHPTFNLWRLGEALVPAGLVALMLALMSMKALQPRFWMAVLGIAVASGLMLVEFVEPGLLRGIVGLRQESWRLNRSVMTLVLLLPFLFMLAETVLQRWIAAAVMLLVLAVVGQSDSAASLLAIMALAATAFLARQHWISISRLVLAGTLLAIVTAPFHGRILHGLMPDALHERLRSASTAIRVMIYQTFDAAIASAPFFGAGFNASTRFWDEPGFQAIPPAMRPYVEFGHPHNAAVQLWVELGLAGVVLVCLIVYLAFRALDRLAVEERPRALGFWAAVAIVALVSHGAWQAWWLALIGIGIVLIAAQSRIKAHSRGIA